MNNNEWITDRLPTLNDTHGTCDCVWVTWSPGDCGQRRWSSVEKDQPWQPLTKPAPYVKPKRWTVEWDENFRCFSIRGYNLVDGAYLPGFDAAAAQRVCDIFNEVLP